MNLMEQAQELFKKNLLKNIGNTCIVAFFSRFLGTKHVHGKRQGEREVEAEVGPFGGGMP